MAAAQQLRLLVGRHDLPISQRPVWEIPRLCQYRPQTRACRLEVKGGRGLRWKAGEATGLAGREPPAISDSALDSSTNPWFPYRPVLCHDDAPGCASDRNTKDNCTPDTPLLPVCAGDLGPGAGDTGRAWCGAEGREGFVEYKPSSWGHSRHLVYFLVCFCFFSIKKVSFPLSACGHVLQRSFSDLTP